MTLSHDSAAILETHVLLAWKSSERGYLHGAIDCDKFMGHPRHAVDLLLAPYVFRHRNANNNLKIRDYVGKLDAYCNHESLSQESEEAFLNLFTELHDYLSQNYS